MTERATRPHPARDAPEEPDHWRLLARRIAGLSHLLAVSGRLTCRRRCGLDDPESRIVMTLGNSGPLPAHHLVQLLEIDKSHVSRAVLRLSSRGLAMRTRTRGPLQLTEAGRATFAALDRLTRARSRLALRGITRSEAEDIRRSLTLVCRAADDLLAAVAPTAPIGAPGADTGDLPVALIDLLRRTARPMRQLMQPFYDRLGALTAVEAHALVWIAEKQPLTLVQLIETMERDKSYMSRTVHKLKAAGLIAAAPGLQSQMLVPTAQGYATYRRILQESYRLNAAYTTHLTERDRETLVDLLWRMAGNARKMLAYERRAGDAVAAIDPKRAEPPPSWRPCLIDLVHPGIAGGDGAMPFDAGLAQMERAALIAAMRRDGAAFMVRSCENITFLDRPRLGEIVEATADILRSDGGTLAVAVRIEAQTARAGDRRLCSEGTFLLAPTGA